MVYITYCIIMYPKVWYRGILVKGNGRNTWGASPSTMVQTCRYSGAEVRNGESKIACRSHIPTAVTMGSEGLHAYIAGHGVNGK